MDIGITNTARTINRSDPELELKKLQPVEKAVGVQSISEKGAVSVSKPNPKDGLDQAPSQREMAKSDLAEVAGKINEMFQSESRSLQFNVDEASGRTVINIVDMQTGEQIKQIPSEELLEISRKLAAHLENKDEMSGMLVKSRA